MVIKMLFMGMFLGIVFSALIAFLFRYKGTQKRSLGQNLRRGAREGVRQVVVDGALETFSALRFFDIRLMRLLFAVLLIAQFSIPYLTGFVSDTNPFTPRVFSTVTMIGLNPNAVMGYLTLILALALVLAPRRSFLEVLSLAWVTVVYFYVSLAIGIYTQHWGDISTGNSLVLTFFGAIATGWSVFLTFYGKTTVATDA